MTRGCYEIILPPTVKKIGYIINCYDACAIQDQAQLESFQKLCRGHDDSCIEFYIVSRKLMNRKDPVDHWNQAGNWSRDDGSAANLAKHSAI
jgi:hypothetical protein